MTSYKEFKEKNYTKVMALGLATEAEAFDAWTKVFFYEKKELETELAAKAKALTFVAEAIKTIGMKKFEDCMSEMGNAKANLEMALETGKMNGVVKDAVLYEISRVK